MVQEQLAEQLDVSRQSVSKWELNDAAPEISKIIALSELFGISTDELLKGAESIPAAAGEKESIAAIARLNAAEKRIRTGFITAVAGLIMLVLELLLLPVMQVMEKNAFGYFLNNAKCTAVAGCDSSGLPAQTGRIPRGRRHCRRGDIHVSGIPLQKEAIVCG